MKEKEYEDGSEVLFRTTLTKEGFMESVMYHYSNPEDFFDNVIEFRIVETEEYDEEFWLGVVKILWDMEPDFVYDIFFGNWDNYKIFEWYWDTEEGPFGIWSYMEYEDEPQKCLERFIETGEYKSAVRDRKINELGI